jgi:hypothetical protein
MGADSARERNAHVQTLLQRASSSAKATPRLVYGDPQR